MGCCTTLSPALTGVHASPKIWIRNQCSHISATLLLTPPSPQSSFTSKKILPPSSLFSNFVNKLSSTLPTAPFSFHSINLTSSLQFLILFLSPKNRPSSRFHLHDPLQDHAYTPLQPLTQRHTSGIWVHVSQRNHIEFSYGLFTGDFQICYLFVPLSTSLLNSSTIFEMTF